MLGNYRTLTYIALAIILGIFVIRPQWGAVQTLSAGITEYSEVLTNLSTYNEQINSLLKRRNALTASEIQRLEKFIGASDTHTAQVVYNLEQTVLARGLSIESVHPFDAERGAGTASVGQVGGADFVSQDFEITVLGSYEAVKEFIHSIESTLEPYTVVYVKFSNESNSDILSTTLRIRVLSLTK